MRNQYGIKVKLYVTLGVVVATAIGGSAYSVLTARHLRETVIHEMVNGAKRLDESRQITTDVANMRNAMRGVSLFSIQNHPEQVQKARAAFEASAADLRKVLQGMETAAAVNEIRSGVDKWLAGFGQFADLSAAGHGDTAAEIALKTLTPLIDAIQKRTAELGRGGQARQDQATELALAHMRRSELLNWVLALTLLLAAGGAFTIVAGLVKTLGEIAASVGTGAREVASAAAQVSSASQSLAQGSSEQAASLQETSAASGEISSMARRNTESSDATSKIALESAGRLDETNR